MTDSQDGTAPTVDEPDDKEPPRQKLNQAAPVSDYPDAPQNLQAGVNMSQRKSNTALEIEQLKKDLSEIQLQAKL